MSAVAEMTRSRSPAGTAGGSEILPAHVVILNNYLRPHHVAVYEALARRVRKLTVLLSTPMEADRPWNPEWGSLDVVVQKNWTWNRRVHHELGFSGTNYVHFPWDTLGHLRRLKPDLICSYEYGPRTLLAGTWRLWSRRSRLIVVGNMSPVSESGRGLLRRGLRQTIRRIADRFTFNGQGCRQYLLEMGIPAARLGHFPYSVDEASVYRGEKSFSADGCMRLVFCGILDERKGIQLLLPELRKWCQSHPDQKVELTVCGTGPLAALTEEKGPSSLSVRLLGHCDSATLRSVYAASDLCLFPSLCDEWGLVPVEALMSGVPVLGSPLAQSVSDLVIDGYNGWKVRPDDPREFGTRLDEALNTSPSGLRSLSRNCRESVRHITADWAAGELLAVLGDALASGAAARPASLSSDPET